MPMTGSAMGDAIATAVQGVTPPSPADAGDAYLKAYWEAVGTAIVNYITAHAQVNVGIAVATTGTASAQTGATTAPGTIS